VTERRGKEQWTFSDAGETAALVGEARSVRSLGPDSIGVVFQPIVDLRTGRNFAAEALVRCKLPEFKSPVALFEAAAAERGLWAARPPPSATWPSQRLPPFRCSSTCTRRS
jgi:hypothetical protein